MPFIVANAFPGAGGTTLLQSLLEQRVQTGLLVQIANTGDNNVNQLRNDEAPPLGLTVPIASA